MKVALLYLFAATASAQTLTPVTAPAGSGIPWWVGFAVAGVILVAGFVWLKVKKPAAAAQVQTTVSADVAALTAAVHKLVEHSSQPLPAVLSTSEPNATPTPNPLQEPLDAANGKLAQIKAIVDA